MRLHRNFTIGLTMALGLGLSGCATWQNIFGSAPQTSNEQQSSASGSTSSGSSQSVPVPASQFTDIPVPTNSRLEMNRTLILGAREEWTGRAYFETPYSVNDLFDFYKREMPNFAWSEVSSARSESSVIVFSRVSRIATIHIVGKSMFAGGATVNILIAPSSGLSGGMGGSGGSGGMAASNQPAPAGMPAPGGPAPVRAQPLR